MAAKNKEKSLVSKAGMVLRNHPPVDVRRDMDHLAENAKSGQAKRTKAQLKYDIEVRKIDSENCKIQSDERVEFEKYRTQRIKYYVWGVGITATLIAGMWSKNLWMQLGRGFLKKFGG